MRILITGGTGLIGRSLSQELGKVGHEVFVLSRNPAEHQYQLPAGVQFIQWDGKSGKGWSHLLDRDTAIVNLAGYNLSSGRWTSERKKLIINSRLNTGIAILSAIEERGQAPKVLVQSSAVGYYGPHGDQVITENHPPGDDFLSGVCVEWENSTQVVEDWGTRRVVIRTGVVLDANEGALARMVLPFKFFIGGQLGDGNQYLSWIHLKDEVAGIRFLLENDQAEGAFNLSAPNPVTNAQFAHLLGKVLGKPSLIPTPGLAIRLLFGEMATIVLDGQRVIPERLEEMGFDFQYRHLEEALRDIL